MLITKGDLLDQERKLAQSGLGEMFDAVEIVSDKTRATYTSAFTRHGTGAEAALMVGNSLKSDVIPALEAGAWGVHVPHDLTWALEHAEPPVAHPRFARSTDLGGAAGFGAARLTRAANWRRSPWRPTATATLSPQWPILLLLVLFAPNLPATPYHSPRKH